MGWLGVDDDAMTSSIKDRWEFKEFISFCRTFMEGKCFVSSWCGPLVLSIRCFFVEFIRYRFHPSLELLIRLNWCHGNVIMEIPFLGLNVIDDSIEIQNYSCVNSGQRSKIVLTTTWKIYWFFSEIETLTADSKYCDESFLVTFLRKKNQISLHHHQMDCELIWQL